MPDGMVKPATRSRLKAVAPKAAEPLVNDWADDLAVMISRKNRKVVAATIRLYALPNPDAPVFVSRRLGHIILSAAQMAQAADKIARFSIRDQSGCWLWTGGKDYDGYGVSGWAGLTVKAHRISYALYKGNIPSGLSVCHTCDIPSCINPEHLWLGDTAANQSDCNKKFRRSGEKSPTHKLTTEMVLKARLESASGESTEIIASRYGMSKSGMQKVLSRASWNHIPDGGSE